MRLKKLFPLIPIASVLLLSAARSGNADAPNQRKNSATNAQDKNTTSTPIPRPQTEIRRDTPTDRGKPETYNYYGNFNYVSRESSTGAEGFWTRHRDAIAGISAILVAVFTGVLVCVGRLQWRTYEAQRILAHGPRLRFGAFVLVGNIQMNEPIEVGLSMTNIGNDRATIKAGNFTVAVSSFEVVEFNEVKNFGDFRTIAEPYKGPHDFMFGKGKFLEAGSQTTPVYQRLHHALTPAHLEGMIAGTLAIWAFGYVFYSDNLGRDHKTAFCRRFDRPTRRFVTTHDSELDYEF